MTGFQIAVAQVRMTPGAAAVLIDGIPFIA
jgi:hypothetical protein